MNNLWNWHYATITTMAQAGLAGMARMSLAMLDLWTYPDACAHKHTDKETLQRK